MVKPRIPYYVVAKGNGYWRPAARMKALGFQDVRCGRDGPKAHEIAHHWNARWQAVRTGKGATPVARPPDRSRGYVYFLRVGERIKIGFSRAPFSRLSVLKTGFSDAAAAVVMVRASRDDERRLHRRFAAARTAGEWFAVTPDILRLMARALTLGQRALQEAEFSSVGRNEAVPMNEQNGAATA